MAKQKKVVVTGFFPDLISGDAYQVARGSGGNLTVAVTRALREIMSSPKVRGKRHRAMKLTVAVVE